MMALYKRDPVFLSETVYVVKYEPIEPESRMCIEPFRHYW